MRFLRRYGWLIITPIALALFVLLCWHPFGGLQEVTLKPTAIIGFFLLGILAVKCEIAIPRIAVVGVDPAYFIPLLLVTRNPSMVMLIVASAYVAVRVHKYRSLRPAIAYDILQMAISYGATGYAWKYLGWPSPLTWGGGFILVGMVVLFAFINFLLYLASVLIEESSLWDKSQDVVRAQGIVYLGAMPILFLTAVALEGFPHGTAVLLPADILLLALLGLSYRNYLNLKEGNVQLLDMNRRMEFYQQLSSAFSLDGETGEDFFRLVLEGMEQHVPSDAAAVIVQMGHGDEDLVIITNGEVYASRQDMDTWFSERFVHQDRPQARRDRLHQEDGVQQILPLSPAMLEGAYAPLQTAEMTLGVLMLQREKQPFDDDELAFVASVTNHIAVGLQDQLLRKELFASLRRISKQRDHLNRILEVGEYLKSDLELDKVLDRIAKSISSALGFRTVLLSLRREKENMFYRAAQAGLDDRWEEIRQVTLPPDHFTQHFQPQFRISHSYFISHRDYETTRTDYDIITSNRKVTKEGEWHPLDSLLIPMTDSNGELVGVISVDEPQDGRVPSYESIQALEVFANQALIAIQIARSYEFMRRQSILDGLTGVFNHRHFQQVLLKEVERHRRGRDPFSLLMLDLDNFKKINDTYGHPVGDQILKFLVEILLEQIRDMDMLCRYGGEEFAIIFPSLGEARVEHVSERIRQRVAESPFTLEDGTTIQITVSIGVALYPRDAGNNMTLIKVADEALYRAKRSGKNKVCYGLG